MKATTAAARRTRSWSHPDHGIPDHLGTPPFQVHSGDQSLHTGNEHPPQDHYTQVVRALRATAHRQSRPKVTAHNRLNSTVHHFRATAYRQSRPKATAHNRLNSTVHHCARGQQWHSNCAQGQQYRSSLHCARGQQWHLHTGRICTQAAIHQLHHQACTQAAAPLTGGSHTVRQSGATQVHTHTQCHQVSPCT